MPSETAPERGRKKPNTRLVMISAAIGALLVLVISTFLSWPFDGGGGVGGPGSKGASPAAPSVADAPPGSCMNWTQADAADIHQLKCGSPHLFELTGRADLRADFPEGAPFPTTEQWQQIKLERCTEVARNFLNGRFDPHGRFSVGAFTPSESGWNSGDRTLHCGLQQPGPSGKLYRFANSVAELDQSDTYEVGRCLGINGTAVWDPVNCTQPHSVEITGVVDLGKEFQGGYPPEEDQDNFLATRCGELTAQYAGSPTAVEDQGLVSYWDTLLPESWEAGSREVNCKVSAQLPDGSGLAPVSGSVKAEVEVGDEPAPESPAPVSPGVPAENPR